MSNVSLYNLQKKSKKKQMLLFTFFFSFLYFRFYSWTLGKALCLALQTLEKETTVCFHFVKESLFWFYLCIFSRALFLALRTQVKKKQLLDFTFIFLVSIFLGGLLKFWPGSAFGIALLNVTFFFRFQFFRFHSGLGSAFGVADSSM